MPPVIIISDQAGAILSSIKEQLPEAQHQICEWHAAEALCAKLRQFHTNLEIQGGKDKEGNIVESLKDFIYLYIKSATTEELETNRKALCDRLQKGGKEYIEKTWKPKEDREVGSYTRFFFNLGCHLS